MLNWFKKNTSSEIPKLFTDIHSHLLPGIDDGVKSLQEAEEIILQFQELGYHKVITTPHIMQDHFRNTAEIILGKLKDVRDHLIDRNIAMEIDAAAEYYLDEHLIDLLERNKPLLTFGSNYLLFETNFLSEPLNLKEFIFLATTKGYKPVLAHPERYAYLLGNIHKVQDLVDRGVLLQLNIGSLTGHYSKPIQNFAFKLIDKGTIHLLGSDCHNFHHVQLIQKAQRSRYFKKALTLPLLNNTL